MELHAVYGLLYVLGDFGNVVLRKKSTINTKIIVLEEDKLVTKKVLLFWKRVS
jgi:hypothetical protein